ncbi:MAG: 23S rRNA (pseudouridine(1915)-N(3))-methyltransferase RlmH [Firmicutes bacterium]|nr:23S rRNA (pseudouridine(1915)-N(3))-methyltransferase RlmH [Bacillota bacterium]
MKKIELICVGKIKENYLKEAIAEYLKRLTRYCELSVLELKEEGDNPSVVVAKESSAILEKIGMRTNDSKGYTLGRPPESNKNITSILLDRTGELITSEQLAAYIDNFFTNGSTKIQFIIGGSHGVDNIVKQSASKIISFGKITYPHQLMRVITLEQIYRSMCILGKVPYHK